MILRFYDFWVQNENRTVQCSELPMDLIRVGVPKPSALWPGPCVRRRHEALPEQHRLWFRRRRSQLVAAGHVNLQTATVLILASNEAKHQTHA